MYESRKFVGPILIILFVVGAVFLVALSQKERSGEIVFETSCRSLSTRAERTDCVEENIRNLLRTKGTAAATGYVKVLTNNAPSGQDCHALMHLLGFFMYEHASDIRETLAHPDLLRCMGGLLHGALEGYLSERDVRELSSTTAAVCSHSSGPGFEWECYHGLGHALMFILDGDVVQSVKECDVLSSELAKNRCYYGVFMENSYQHNGLYHGPSVKFLKENDPYYPCYEMEEQYRTQCYGFAGRSHLLDIAEERRVVVANLQPSDFKSAFDVCYGIRGPEEYRENCVGEVAVYLQIAYPTDFDSVQEICGYLSVESGHRWLCYSRMARLIRKYDLRGEALAGRFCAGLEHEYVEQCHDVVRKDAAWYPNRSTL